MIAEGGLLLIVERGTQVLDAAPHGVLPSRIAVGEEVFIHWGVRFFDLRMGGRLEVEVQILREVPAQGEVTIPKELRVEGKRQTMIVKVLHVTLLQLVVGTGNLSVQGQRLGQVVQSEGLGEVQPLRLTLQLSERLPRLIHGRIAVVNGTAPLVILLIDGSLARGVTMGVTITEREVGRVVGHRMAFRFQAPAHVRDGEVGVGGPRDGNIIDAVALLLAGSSLQRIIKAHVVVEWIITWFHCLLRN